MFAIYYGEDDFSRREAVRVLQEKLGDPEMASLNTAVLAANDAKPAEVIAQASAVPFLAPGRLVVVEGLLGLFEARPGRGGSERRGKAKTGVEGGLGGWEALAEAGPRLPDSNMLLLTDGPVNAANPLLKVLAPAAEVRQFFPLRGPALEEWVRRRVATQGGKIVPEAVRRLVEACGGNLWALDAETSKLLVFASGRPITVEDVEALVSEVREENIFNLVDDIIERRYPQARTRLQSLVEGGAVTGQVIAMLARQVRMLIAGKDLKERGASRQELEEGVGTRSDFALRKALGQSEKFSMNELIAMHRRLLDYDVAIKTGVLSESTALELLVAELCGVGKTRVAGFE